MPRLSNFLAGMPPARPNPDPSPTELLTIRRSLNGILRPHLDPQRLEGVREVFEPRGLDPLSTSQLPPKLVTELWEALFGRNLLPATWYTPESAPWLFLASHGRPYGRLSRSPNELATLAVLAPTIAQAEPLLAAYRTAVEPWLEESLGTATWMVGIQPELVGILDRHLMMRDRANYSDPLGVGSYAGYTPRQAFTRKRVEQAMRRSNAALPVFASEEVEADGCLRWAEKRALGVLADADAFQYAATLGLPIGDPFPRGATFATTPNPSAAAYGVWACGLSIEWLYARRRPDEWTGLALGIPLL